jgi:hypothetical protein
MAEYVPDHSGVGQFLRSRQMQEMLLAVANRIKDEAITRSPVGEETREREVHYRDSFHTAVVERGGATGDRAEAQCWNDSPQASFVEWGRYGVEPYHTLLRASAEVRL